MKALALFVFLFGSLAVRASDLEPLRSNGNIFYRAEERLPLRCLDLTLLLAMDDKSQDALLDKAAAAGFNSVSFSAPLFGEGSFCEKLGTLNSGRISAFKRSVFLGNAYKSVRSKGKGVPVASNTQESSL